MNRSKIYWKLLLCSTFAWAATAGAQQPDAKQALALVEKHGCASCHQPDQRILGPSYQEIAAKYKGKPEVIKALTIKVIKGGSGVWGQIPMTPNEGIPETELQTMLQWIMAQ